MVEAAGVEPASENVTGQEPTCVVQSHALGITPGSFAAAAQNGQETASASLMILSSHSDGAGKTSPLCDVRSQPTGEAAEDGYLTN